MRDKVFKCGLSKFCGRQPLKSLRDPSMFFKGCVPQNVFSPQLFEVNIHIKRRLKN